LQTETKKQILRYVIIFRIELRYMISGSSLFLTDKILFNLPALVFVMISTLNSGEPYIITLELDSEPILARVNELESHLSHQY
jgi:hypothetical protein